MTGWAPNAQSAIDAGIDFWAQAQRLTHMAQRLSEHCDKLPTTVEKAECVEAVDRLLKQGGWFMQNADEVNATFGDKIHGFPPGQKAADKVYETTYFQVLGGGKAAADRTISEVQDQVEANGWSPSAFARWNAAQDVKAGAPFQPPIYNPDHFSPPLAPPAEEPGS